MKSLIFDTVKVNDTISFNDNGMIESGVVVKVDNNKFGVRVLRCWDNNGIPTYYESILNFYKTGTKTHANHTHGNAIAITGTI